MWLPFFAIVGGIAVMVWGAERFITGASALARNLGVSSLTIGLTVVGLGTSAPEILVSAVAVLHGNPQLAVGNAVGSNIANIGLILGATALVLPLRVSSRILRREYPVVLGVSFLAFALLWNGELSRFDGGLLALLLLVIILWQIYIAWQGDSADPLSREMEETIPSGMPTGKALLWLMLGLTALLASSRTLVWGAVEVATYLGVSDLVIGLSIVAIGTSLPELAASLASAFKDEVDMAIGNVLGSNLFNLLAVLSIPGLLSPGAVDAALISRDLPVMLVLTVAIYFMTHRRFSPNTRINRFEGLALLMVFGGYQLLLYFSAALS